MDLRARLSGRESYAVAGSLALAGVLALVVAIMALSGEAAPEPSRAQAPTPTPTPTDARAPGTEAPSPSPVPARYAALLDGVFLTEAEWQARASLLPLAVMVDNSPGAFPHVGLDRADLIYETFVEGGITRFMAVFWRREAEVLEPVRSARTPFVIWASELDALYGHAGGATTFNEADAIGQIAEWKVRDLDAFVSGSSGAYYRDPERYAPYNLGTATVRLREAAAKLGQAGPARLEPWRFKADGEGAAGLPPAGGIEVNFSERRAASQVIQWRWDAATNSYLRFQWGGPHADGRTGEQLRFKNLVVMRVPGEVVDHSGHYVLEQFGQGPAMIFTDGRVIDDATWEKKDRQARTRFFDARGREIAFNRGPIFIEVVAPRSLVTIAATADALAPLPPYEPPVATAPEPEPSPSPSPSPSNTPAANTPATGTAPAGTPASPASSATPGTSTPGTAAPGASATVAATPVATASATAQAPPAATATVPPASPASPTPPPPAATPTP